MALLALLTALIAPIYFRNVQLRSYVNGLTSQAASRARTDDTLRDAVIERARELHLPVKAENMQVVRASGGLRIEVRYPVRLTLPGYTVDLHFEAGSTSR